MGSKADEFRKHAERAFKPIDKERWLRIAEQWLKVAESADQEER